METELVRYLPGWFRDIRDFRVLMETETGELEALAAAMAAVRDNLHLAAADAGTVRDWEGMLHITPNPAVETLEFRRARIVNRLSSTPPFTLRFLYERLDLLIGKGKWAVTVDYPGSTLYVEAAAENQAWAGEVLATLSTSKPCHIAYVSRPLVPAKLLMSETVHLTEQIFYTRLGYWGLGSRPFSLPEDRGVIVMPEQRTLQEELFQGVAGFTASEVAAARINGGTVISEFTVKAASGDVATVEYTVKPGQADAVTLVELLNGSGEVLERAPVYVPVVDPVRFTHRITVKEGV